MTGLLSREQCILFQEIKTPFLLFQVQFYAQAHQTMQELHRVLSR